MRKRSTRINHQQRVPNDQRAHRTSHLGLSIGDFVDSEPFLRGTQVAGQMPLDILNIVQSARQGIIDINDDNLPVGLSLVQECHNTEDLDLLDFSDLGDTFADLADVEGIVVAVGFGLGVGDRGVFPCLGEGSVVPDLSSGASGPKAFYAYL